MNLKGRRPTKWADIQISNLRIVFLCISFMSLKTHTFLALQGDWDDIANLWSPTLQVIFLFLSNIIGYPALLFLTLFIFNYSSLCPLNCAYYLVFVMDIRMCEPQSNRKVCFILYKGSLVVLLLLILFIPSLQDFDRWRCYLYNRFWVVLCDLL